MHIYSKEQGKEMEMVIFIPFKNAQKASSLVEMIIIISLVKTTTAKDSSQIIYPPVNSSLDLSSFLLLTL